MEVQSHVVLIFSDYTPGCVYIIFTRIDVCVSHCGKRRYFVDGTSVDCFRPFGSSLSTAVAVVARGRREVILLYIYTYLPYCT